MASGAGITNAACTATLQECTARASELHRLTQRSIDEADGSVVSLDGCSSAPLTELQDALVDGGAIEALHQLAQFNVPVAWITLQVRALLPGCMYPPVVLATAPSLEPARVHKRTPLPRLFCRVETEQLRLGSNGTGR